MCVAGAKIPNAVGREEAQDFSCLLVEPSFFQASPRKATQADFAHARLCDPHQKARDILVLLGPIVMAVRGLTIRMDGAVVPAGPASASSRGLEALGAPC